MVVQSSGVGSIVSLSGGNSAAMLLPLVCDIGNDISQLEVRVGMIYDWMNREARKDWLRRRRIRSMEGLR